MEPRSKVSSTLTNDAGIAYKLIPTGSETIARTIGVVVLSKFSTLYVGTTGHLAVWLYDDDLKETYRLFKTIQGNFPRLVKAIDWDNTTADDIILDL